ncbi:MAG: hypothetical protein AAFY25_04045 [Pseudomonadota bacterium]
MTNEPETGIAERLEALETKVEQRTLASRAFPTATVLAVLPVGFGLYQFHLSNEFKKEDNQTRALLAALQGETPSDICGNLSLLVEGGLVTEERLMATESLISQITQRDGRKLDGGIDDFDCLPRITSEDGDPAPAGPAQPDITLADRRAAPTPCFYDEVEVEVIPEQDPELLRSILDYLDREGVIFAAIPVEPTEWEINNYSGKIWYYSIESRKCAASIARGLEPLGITLIPRYYTRENLPDGLPIRIWPGI